MSVYYKSVCCYKKKAERSSKLLKNTFSTNSETKHRAVLAETTAFARSTLDIMFKLNLVYNGCCYYKII